MVDSTSESKGPKGSEKQLRQYNYEHFGLKHLAADLWRSARGEGLRPGSEAPDFELESTDGGQMRLSAFRGRPVLVHIGNGT